MSGGPDERSEMLALVVPPLLVGIITTVIAINLWGPWGIVAGVLAGGAALVIFAGLQLL